MFAEWEHVGGRGQETCESIGREGHRVKQPTSAGSPLPAPACSSFQASHVCFPRRWQQREPLVGDLLWYPTLGQPCAGWHDASEAFGMLQPKMVCMLISVIL